MPLDTMDNEDRTAVMATPALAVHAPIITDGITEEGVAPLVKYVAAIETHSNTDVFAKETERLQPYFSALSTYLTHALQNTDIADNETLQDLITPGQLSAAFNKMAEYTRNTLISDFVIMPSDIKTGPAASLFAGYQFDPAFSYGETGFNFGFLQILEKDNKRGSTTIPTLTLDAGLMKEIAPHQPEKLYKNLQTILTAMNHDMLHHLHSPLVSGGIARKFVADAKERWAPHIAAWGASLGSNRLEEWSQVSHGKMFMAPNNDHLVEEVSNNIDACFDELARITQTMPKSKAHGITDYFGTVIAQTLSRAFPFNHAVMMKCIDRMQEIDPLSEAELLEDAFRKYSRMRKDTIFEPQHLRDTFKWLANQSHVATVRDIIAGYRQLGLDLLPDDDSAMTFKNLKLIQLATLEADEMRTHVPAPINPAEQKVRADSDRNFLELVRAVNKTNDNRIRYIANAAGPSPR